MKLSEEMMKEAFDFIKLSLSERKYYIKNFGMDYDNYLDLNMPLGCSRIGGPMVDLPDEIIYPDNCNFVAQLNCAELKSYDKIGLLPENGFLYFFEEDYDKGYVFYTLKGKESLHRTIKEHENNYFFGKKIENYKMEIESVESRYTIQNGIKEWDYFGGGELSKIYGIYTNCQASEKEIIQFMEDENKIILLQIGTDYFDEGCESIIINKNDLINKDFSKCIFEYNQS
jgi:uncharacterized protein YwqG